MNLSTDSNRTPDAAVRSGLGSAMRRFLEDGTGEYMAVRLSQENALQANTIEDCVAAARAMVSALRAREPSATARRRIPAETIADFHDASFFFVSPNPDVGLGRIATSTS